MAERGESDDDALETEVIARIMEEKGVLLHRIRKEPGTDLNDLEAVKTSRRYFRVKGSAWFEEHEEPGGGTCSRSWRSAHAWCIMDLKEQEIAQTFGQECQQCEEMVYPDFDEDALERMADYATDSYLRKIRKLPRQPKPRDMSDDDEHEDSNPHDERRCELCQMLGSSCWK